ncbi:MAG: hypothetical protein Q9187_002818 [Circinaria calcarea]
MGEENRQHVSALLPRKIKNSYCLFMRESFPPKGSDGPLRVTDPLFIYPYTFRVYRRLLSAVPSVSELIKPATAFKLLITESHNYTMNTAEHQAQDVDSAYVEFAESIPLDTVVFPARELQLLELYDQLQELRLEHALLEAQNTVAIGHYHCTSGGLVAETPTATDQILSVQDAESEIKTLERECLEARSTYLLRESIVKDVVLADPTLKAVHSGVNANPTEQYLRRVLDRRDILSIAHTNLSASLHSTLNDLSTTELHNITCIAKNQELTRTLLVLAGKLKAQEIADTDDPELRRRIENVRNDTKESKGRWRIMKSVVAAIIAGSGIDWAGDEDLCELVLDDED